MNSASKLARPSGDYQRKLVYAWENVRLHFFQHSSISDDACREMIRAMCHEFKLPVPDMYFGRMKNGGANARAGKGALSFTSGSISPFHPVHEFAHYANKMHDAHGPHFLRVYIHLLAKFIPQHLTHFTIHTLDAKLEDLLFDDAISFGICVARMPIIGTVAWCTQDDIMVDLYDMLKDAE